MTGSVTRFRSGTIQTPPLQNFFTEKNDFTLPKKRNLPITTGLRQLRLAAHNITANQSLPFSSDETSVTPVNKGTSLDYPYQEN